MDEKIAKLQEWIDDSNRVVFFGGAGVSTESGIPDFRSPDGLYHQKYAYPPEQMLSHTFFVTHPEEFFEFYRDKMLPPDVKPNIVHTRLAEMEKSGKLTGVVTQNIDGLHQMAGSEKVFELHGSVKRNYCTRCGKFFPEEYIKDSTGVPKCDACGATVKPDVVLYEEGLDPKVLQGAIKAIEDADMMIVGGTSLVVYPAASLVDYFRGKRLVLINKEATPYDRKAGLVLHESLGRVFDQLHP